VALKTPFPASAKPATLAAAISTISPVAMLEHGGGATEYRHRGYAWCNRMRAAPGEAEKYSCMTPQNVAVCPANMGSIAFESSADGAQLIGFAKGGDCSAQEELGISWISLVSPYVADLTKLMKDGALDAKFTKHV